MRAQVLLASAVTGVVSVTGAGLGTGSASDPYAYTGPPFAKQCTIHRFGDGVAPDLTGYPDDPLCVEYQKRDITADNGGAVRFAFAEPARFAIALPKCRYWQQDHWRVQVDRGAAHIVQWDGSYWFDKGSGRAGAILRNFRIDGRPTEPGAAADAVGKVSPQLANAMRTKGAAVNSGIPFDPSCPR